MERGYLTMNVLTQTLMGLTDAAAGGTIDVFVAFQEPFSALVVYFAARFS